MTVNITKKNRCFFRIDEMCISQVCYKTEKLCGVCEISMDIIQFGDFMSVCGALMQVHVIILGI